MAPAKERPATKTIATNREARHEYFVLKRWKRASS